MENKLREIIIDNQLNDGANISLYDYISQNYSYITKEVLKELILNLDYALYSTLNREKCLEIETQALNDTLERIGE